MKLKNICKWMVLAVFACCILMLGKDNAPKAKAATTWSVTYDWNTGTNSKKVTKKYSTDSTVSATKATIGINGVERYNYVLIGWSTSIAPTNNTTIYKNNQNDTIVYKDSGFFINGKRKHSDSKTNMKLYAVWKMIYDSTYVHVGGTIYCNNGYRSSVKDSSTKSFPISRVVYLPKKKTDEMLAGLEIYSHESIWDYAKILLKATYKTMKDKMNEVVLEEIFKIKNIGSVEDLIMKGVEYTVPGFSRINNLKEGLELLIEIFYSYDDIKQLAELYEAIITKQAESPQGCVKIYYGKNGNYDVASWDYRSIDSKIKGHGAYTMEYYTTFSQQVYENEIDKILNLSAIN